MSIEKCFNSIAIAGGLYFGETLYYVRGIPNSLLDGGREEDDKLRSLTTPAQNIIFLSLSIGIWPLSGALYCAVSIRRNPSAPDCLRAVPSLVAD